MHKSSVENQWYIVVIYTLRNQLNLVTNIINLELGAIIVHFINEAIVQKRSNHKWHKKNFIVLLINDLSF